MYTYVLRTTVTITWINDKEYSQQCVIKCVDVYLDIDVQLIFEA